LWSGEKKMQLAQARNEFYASNSDNEEEALSNLLGAYAAKKQRERQLNTRTDYNPWQGCGGRGDESMANGMKRFNWNE
jgi:hypothetical protein